MHFFDPITDFIFIEHEVEAADVIFIPGGPCGEIALHAAELYHQGYAPLLIPSGKHSILDPIYRGAQSPEKYRGREFPTEADFFSTILLDQDVPSSCIRPERQATFTYENAIYTESLRMRSVLPSGRQSFPARPITHGVHSFTIRLFFRMRRSWSLPPSRRESERKTGS